jgi:hypothetical protein
MRTPAERLLDKLDGTEWADAEHIERGVEHFDKLGKRKVYLIPRWFTNY